MSQRRVPEGKKVIPVTAQEEPSGKAVVAEDIVFDKAERAEHIEKERRQVVAEIETLEASFKEATDEDKERIKTQIADYRERLKVLEMHEDGTTPNGDVRNVGEPASRKFPNAGRQKE